MTPSNKNVFMPEIQKKVIWKGVITRMKKQKWLLVGLLALVLIGCNQEKQLEQQENVTPVITQTEQNEEHKKEEETPKTPTPTPTDVPVVDKSVYMDKNRSIAERVEALLKQMTLDEKIAQMVQPEQNEASGGASPADVKKYGIGSVLSGGGSAPGTGNTAEDWKNRVSEYLAAAKESRLGIPLLYGVDAVHGHNNVADAVIFPHNIGLGAAGDTALVEKIGAAVASEVYATGIRWTFAPTVGLPFNERWGRTYECFGETTELVSRMGAAFVRGFQGVPGTDGFLARETVIATAKHYIGEGQTENGVNQGNVAMETADWEKLLYEELLEPYRAAVEAGARSVMVSYNSIDGLKCHENRELITDVLKGELGFTGIVVSDYNGIDQVQGATYADKVTACINAGVDVFMEPYDWKEFMRAAKKQVENGAVSEERIDDAVRRILTVKFELGLFDETEDERIADTMTAVEKFGSQEHRAVAKEAVEKSLVLLKNDTPSVWQTLKEAKNLLVVGKKADDIGAQCGGWTISWQGSMGEITTGTSILEGIRKVAGADTQVEFSARGTVSKAAEAVIVVVGEEPYAESNGDRGTSELCLSAEDKAVLKRVQETMEQNGKKVPVILVLLSGRPITIAEEISQADAVVAAWLPGTEGDGIAEVLLGDKEFSGTLTYTWPWYAADIKEKQTDTSKVLFCVGTGLKKDGTSILAHGTVKIGKKPEAPQEAMGAAEGEIDLKAVNYKVEAEWMNRDSYLVETATEGEVTYVGNWGGQWSNTKWNVYVSEAGTYRIHFVYRADKASSSMAIYYATPSITDDGNANRTAIPIQKTGAQYEEATLDVTLKNGAYEFKFMSSGNGVSMKLDYLYFEPLEVSEAVVREELDVKLTAQGKILAEDAVTSYMTSEYKPGDGTWYQQEYEKESFLTEREKIDITEADTQEATTIHLYPEQEGQTMLGIGTSLEESTIHHLKDMDAETRRAFLMYLIDPENGAGMSLFRLTIGTADFTAEPFYTYYDARELNESNSVNGKPDWYNETGNGFSIQKDVELKITDVVLEVLQIAKELGVKDEIRFFASSWTPPGWMKKETASSRSYGNNELLLKGGKLADEHIENLAMYYVRYLEEYKKLGITISGITLQNEPMLEIDYPSCKMTATQEGKLAVAIREKLAESELLQEEEIFLWAYDHNPDAAVKFTKELFQVPGAKEAVSGIAFHDYSDPISAMSEVKDKLLAENQVVALTERSVWGTSGADRMLQYFRNGAVSYNAWVTMLDSKIQAHQWVGTPGPTLFVRDWQSKTDYWATPEVALIGQFARFVRPGDVLVSSDYGSAATVTGAAFKNTDGSMLTVILVNQTRQQQPVRIQWENRQILDIVPEKHVITYQIPLE